MEIKCRVHDVTSAGYVGVRIFSVDVEVRNELPICMSLHDAGTTNGNENATEKIFSTLTPYQVLITCPKCSLFEVSNNVRCVRTPC
jgi:hypothetical protein